MMLGTLNAFVYYVSLKKSIIMRTEMWSWNNFSCFQWDIPPLLWLLYRCFMLVYTVSWLIYTALLFNTPKFLIFLSHISYCLMVIYYLVALSNLAWAFLEVRCSSHRMKRGIVVQSVHRLSIDQLIWERRSDPMKYLNTLKHIWMSLH